MNEPTTQTLNSRNRAILASLFEKPTRTDIRWADIVTLITALGGTVTCKSGSHHRLSLNGEIGIAARPHPQSTVARHTVKAVAEFLRKARVA